MDGDHSGCAGSGTGAPPVTRGSMAKTAMDRDGLHMLARKLSFKADAGSPAISDVAFGDEMDASSRLVRPVACFRVPDSGFPRAPPSHTRAVWVCVQTAGTRLGGLHSHGKTHHAGDHPAQFHLNGSIPPCARVAQQTRGDGSQPNWCHRLGSCRTTWVSAAAVVVRDVS